MRAQRGKTSLRKGSQEAKPVLPFEDYYSHFTVQHNTMYAKKGPLTASNATTRITAVGREIAKKYHINQAMFKDFLPKPKGSPMVANRSQSSSALVGTQQPTVANQSSPTVAIGSSSALLPGTQQSMVANQSSLDLAVAIQLSSALVLSGTQQPPASFPSSSAMALPSGAQQQPMAAFLSSAAPVLTRNDLLLLCIAAASPHVQIILTRTTGGESPTPPPTTVTPTPPPTTVTPPPPPPPTRLIVLFFTV